MKTILLITFLSSLFSVIAQPSNNNCSSSTAFQLTPVASATSGNAVNWNVSGATQSYSPTNCYPTPTSVNALDVFFKFTATQSSYVIQVNPSSGYDPAVFVYNSCNGTVVACSDDGGGNGQPEQVILNNLANGTYYIRVYDYDNTGSPVSYTSTFEIWVVAPSVSGNASIDFDPNSIAFGTIQQNTSSTQQVDIENTGTADLVISDIDYSNSAFNGPSYLPVIHPGDVLPLSVTFNPTSTGSFNGIVTIVSNAPSSPDQFNVSGTGSSTPSAQISVSTNSMSFGSVQQSTTSPAQQFVITNTGNASLTVTSISTPTGYAADWNGGVITAGNNRTVNVTFTPPSTGAYNGTITIANTATAKTISVTGNGIAGAPTTITGTVKDIEVLWSSNTVQSLGLNGCVVYLKTNGGSIITSATTTSSGFFTLNATPGSTYYVEATISDSYGTFSIGKTAVSVGSNLEILIPRKITGQIETLLDNLENLQVHIDAFGVYKPVEGYNTSSVQNTVDGFDDFDNTYAKVRDNLTRLYLAERIVSSYYENAALIGDEMSTNFNAFLGIIGRMVSILSKIQTLTNGSVILNWVFEPIELIIEGGITFAEYAFEHTSSALTGQAKADYEMLMDWELDHMKYIIQNDPTSVANLLTNPIRLAVSHLTPFAINRVYVRPTQFSLESAATQTSYLNQTYNYTNSSAIQQTKLEVYAIGSHSAQVKSAMANLLFVNDVAQSINDLGNMTSGVLAFTGIGTAAIPIIQGIGTVTSVFGYSAVGYSCIKGWNEMKYLKTTVGLDIDGYAFYKTDGLNSELNGNQANKTNDALSDAFDNYNAQLLSIIDDIDYSHESDAFNKLNNLAQRQAELNKAITESINPILAASPTLLDSVASFGNTYYSQFVTPLMNANAKKIGFGFEMMALTLDTTDYTINTNLVAQGNNIITANNALEVAITQFTNLSIGVSTLPYVGLTNKTWSREMNSGSSQQLKVVFKNYGSTSVTDAYALITTTGGFSSNNDSVYIGTINAGASDSVTYTITAPVFDTISGFQWQLLSGNGYGLGTGGVLSTAKRVSGNNDVSKTPTFAMLVSPNPANAFTAIEFNSSTTQEISLSIIDVLGKEFRNEKFTCTQGKCFHTLSTMELPNGVYWISAKGVQGTSTSKVSVQH